MKKNIIESYNILGKDVYKNKILQSLGIKQQKKSRTKKKIRIIKEKEKSADFKKGKSPKKLIINKSVKKKSKEKKQGSNKRSHMGSHVEKKKSMEV